MKKPRAFPASGGAAPWICICLFAFAHLQARPAIGADDKDIDEWHRIYLEGKPAGYLRIVSTPREGGGHAVRIVQKLTLKRGSTVIETEVSSSQEEDAQGKLVGFQMEQKLSRETLETSGKVEGDRLVMIDTVRGKEARRSTIPMDPSAVGYKHADDLARAKLKEEGDSLEVVIFSPELRMFGRQKAVMGKEVPVDFLGSRRTLREVTVTLDVLPGIITKQWCDENQDLQKSSMPVFGMELVTYRSTPQEVLAADISSPPEIFVASSIPVNKSVPAGSSKARYRLKSKQPAFPVFSGNYLFKGPGQELQKEEGPRERILVVRKVLPRRSSPQSLPRAVELPLSPGPELSEYLKPSTYVQSDDKGIAKLTSRALGGERDAWKAACRLERWVHENIRVKNLSTAFATAREVAETKEGDCTEHAVLLAAMLRAAGMPSRVVAGLLYHGGSFVGHMWTEVHLGEWIPLDATKGDGFVGADHIGLAASSLDSSAVSSFFLDMVPVFGNMEIEVLDVEP
jgi:hypothetical protein